MKMYWDKDDCISYFFSKKPTVYTKKPIELDENIYKAYEAIAEAYYRFQDYFEDTCEPGKWK
jgi:hypothetical protein